MTTVLGDSDLQQRLEGGRYNFGFSGQKPYIRYQLVPSDLYGMPPQCLFWFFVGLEVIQISVYQYSIIAIHFKSRLWEHSYESKIDVVKIKTHGLGHWFVLRAGCSKSSHATLKLSSFRNIIRHNSSRPHCTTGFDFGSRFCLGIWRRCGNDFIFDLRTMFHRRPNSRRYCLFTQKTKSWRLWAIKGA